MSSEREAIMAKARLKRQRRAEAVAKATHGKERDGDPSATLTEKVSDFAQDAAAQVGHLFMAAAHKITESIAPSEQKPA